MVKTENCVCMVNILSLCAFGIAAYTLKMISTALKKKTT